MSKARKVLASLGTLLLVLAGAPAAHATDTVITVRSFDTGGQAFFPWLFGCDLTPATGTGPKALVEATSPAPLLGTRSWGFQPTQSGQFYGWGVDVASVGQLDTFRIAVHGADAGSGIAQVFVTPVDTPPDRIWVGAVSVGGSGNAWSIVDASDLTYSWSRYNLDPFVKEFTGAPATIVDFVSAHGGTTTGITAAIGFGCSGQPFHYDAFQYGAPGAVTTLDFETARTQLTAGPGRTITAGQKATLTGTTTAHMDPVTPVQLQSRPYGASTWSTITTVAAPWSEFETLPLSTQVAPLKQTSYRWYLAGSEAFEERYSSTMTVKVRTAISASIVDRTLRRGQSLVVKGRTKPAKPGATVTLWRKTSTGAIVLATTRVRSDGTYKAAYPVNRRGTWTVWTTVAAASGNLAGRSPNRSATVG